jgi:hypothetical protein
MYRDGYGSIKNRTAQVCREFAELVQQLNFLYDKMKLSPDIRKKKIRNAEWLHERDRSVTRLKMVPPVTSL